MRCRKKILVCSGPLNTVQPVWRINKSCRSQNNKHRFFKAPLKWSRTKTPTWVRDWTDWKLAVTLQTVLSSLLASCRCRWTVPVIEIKCIMLTCWRTYRELLRRRAFAVNWGAEPSQAAFVAGTWLVTSSARGRREETWLETERFNSKVFKWGKLWSTGDWSLWWRCFECFSN